jgi:RNA polymerase sigma factor (sigma-70 family)
MPGEGPKNAAALKFSVEVMPHLEPAYTLARWLTGNSADADDVFQEAAIRALRFINDLEEGKAKPWFLKIVRNTAYTWLKKSRRFVELDEADHSEADSNPEIELLGKVKARELHAALARLPAEFREALVLRELEQLSYREIAAITGLADGTVMSRLSRARAQLKRELNTGKENKS